MATSSAPVVRARIGALRDELGATDVAPMGDRDRVRLLADLTGLVA